MGGLSGRRTTDVILSRSEHWAAPTSDPILHSVAGDRGRVVVADDDVLLREGLGSLLTTSGFDLVGQCGDSTQLLALIREELPETAILVLSAHVEVEQATELLASGQRSGYLLKDRVSDVDDFLATLDRIMKGAAVVDPALVQELLAARRVKDPLEALSAREREVLALMAEGRSNAGIAHQLWVTEGTVEKHVRSILMKLRIPEASDDHRRVLAVLTFLDSH
jgi:DNA-binding NarL/FixJ family response regulator